MCLLKGRGDTGRDVKVSLGEYSPSRPVCCLSSAYSQVWPSNIYFKNAKNLYPQSGKHEVEYTMEMQPEFFFLQK